MSVGTSVGGRTAVDRSVGVAVAVSVDVGIAVDNAATSRVGASDGVGDGSKTDAVGVEFESVSTIPNISANASTPTATIATITSLPKSRRI